MPKELNIFGAGGHATSVANIGLSLGYSIHSFIDPNFIGSSFLGSQVVSSINHIEISENSFFAIAIGDNFSRESIHSTCISIQPYMHFPALIHPTATISSWTKIGDGVVIMPNVVVGPNCAIGKFCILNTLSSIDHDSIIDDFVSIAPGVICGGKVNIGRGSFIGLNASIRHGISIGPNTVVGASSYVNVNIPHNKLAYGVPAKVIRSRNSNTPYLS
jgi:sugar O-acyltransferase (sialic acid O-acetyltransferase NeuD family)